jgi:hypothetical protein
MMIKEIDREPVIIEIKKGQTGKVPNLNQLGSSEY